MTVSAVHSLCFSL